MDSAPQAETPANTCDEEGDQAGVSTADVDRRPGSPTGTRSASQPATETQRKSRGVEEDGQPSESRKVTESNTCDEEGDQAGVSTEDVDRRPGSPTGTRSASQPATETQRKSRGVEEDGQPSESRKVTESLPGYKDLPVVVSAPETETAKEGCDQENDESSEDIQIVSVKMTKKDTTGPSSTERSDERSEHATTPASDPSGSQVVDITDLHSESDEIPWDPNEVKIVDVADEEGITDLPVELVAEIMAQDYIPRDHGVYRRICSGQVVLEFLNTVRNSEGRTIIHKFWEYKGDAYRVSRLNLEEYNPFDEMDMRKYWDKW